MKKILITVILTMVVEIIYAQVKEPVFTPATGPLMTTWSKDVDVKRPLPEYPRPQLARKEWLNLNGIWEFESGNLNDILPRNKTLSKKILVPYPVESALSGIMKHHDRIWYRRTFKIPIGWKGKNIIINFGAVDWQTEVFINGNRVGQHEGGYDSFSFNITPFLTKGEQEIIVKVYDPTENLGIARGKQTTKPFEIMYTPTTGIWQTVWLEPVDQKHISDLELIPDIDQSALNVNVGISAGKELDVLLKIKDSGKLICSKSGKTGEVIKLNLKNPILWSPVNPKLHDIEISLIDQGVVVDVVKSYFGMRKIAMKEVDGVKKIYLNNEFLYQAGVLDQGFWPDGLYTAPTDVALKSDVEQAKKLGFNLIRKHAKIEPQRWYYWADKLGVLVWQDMPSVNSYLPKDSFRPEINKPQFKTELLQMIRQHKNSPAIVMWVLFNETQGQHDTKSLVETIREEDPHRLVNEASGDEFYGYGDVIDRHDYPSPICPESKTHALAIGEFGGIGYKIEGHTWASKADGFYTNAINPGEMLFLYREYYDRLRDFKDHQGLSASIYTQLTDVETETNGLLTYDRIQKHETAAIKLLTTFDFAKQQYTPVLSTSESQGQEWKVIFTPPSGKWYEPGFDDSSWTKGIGGFGNRGKPERTKWVSDDIWLRASFNPRNLTRAQINKIVLRIMYEREVEVYINGKIAFRGSGSRKVYENRPISQSVKDSILPDGVNVIAIHCKKKNFPFIDAGLLLRTSIEKNELKGKIPD